MTENMMYVGTFILTSKLAVDSPPYEIEAQEMSKRDQERHPGQRSVPRCAT